MFEIEEQNLVCQFQSIFDNKRLTEVEIKQLGKKTKNEEIAPEMSYGWLIGAETVREQFYDLKVYHRGTPEDHIENPIHQCLIQIMHEGVKEIFRLYVVET